MVDEAGGSVFWPNQQVYDACNEVIIDLWANTKIQTTSTPFVVTSNVDIYPLPLSTIMIPQFFVLNTTIGQEVINQKYFISDQAKLEQWSRVWRQNGLEQPRFFIPFGLTQMRVFPKPDQTYTFTLWGVPWPAEVTSTNEDLAVDRQLKLAVAYRAASVLFEATRPDLADAFAKESDDALNRYKMRVRNIQKHNIRRLRPNARGSSTAQVSAAQKGVIVIGRKLP